LKLDEYPLLFAVRLRIFLSFIFRELL